MSTTSTIRQPRPLGAPALAAALALLLILPAGAAIRTGTPNGEVLTGTRRADTIDGRGGDDALRGLAGDDTYRFADDWGSDTLTELAFYRVGGKRVPGGVDTLSFKGVEDGFVVASLVTEWRGVVFLHGKVEGSDGSSVDLDGSRIENVVGTRQRDVLMGGSGANRLAAGGGQNDELLDFGGWDDGPGNFPDLPASDDTYVGAATTGGLTIADWGGKADLLDLRPLRLDEVVLNRFDCDGDPAKECLQIVTGVGDGQVVVHGQFGEFLDGTATTGQHGRIETLLFADRAVTFGGSGRAAGAQDGEALLGRAETPRQQELAERAPALAEEAREQARDRLPLGEPPRARDR